MLPFKSVFFFQLLPVVLPDVSVIMDEVSSQFFPTTTADFEAATLSPNLLDLYHIAIWKKEPRDNL